MLLCTPGSQMWHWIPFKKELQMVARPCMDVQNRIDLFSRREQKCYLLLKHPFSHFPLSLHGSNLTSVFRNVRTLIHCISWSFISCRECQYTQIVPC